MWILIVYVLNVLVGELIVIAIGLGLDKNLPVCQFTNFFVAILLCVLVRLGSCGTLD